MEDDVGGPDDWADPNTEPEPKAEPEPGVEDVRPLPQSLTEYLDVWCADLIEPLTAQHRFDLRNGVAIMYIGGPWPDRLSIQRNAEMRAGVIARGAMVAEGILEYSSIPEQVQRLEDPSSRDYAMKRLGSFQGTPELVTAVNDAHARGVLTDGERRTILEEALSQPFLPDPVPLPQHLRPLPANWPESYAALAVRNEHEAYPAPPHVQAR